MWNRFPLITRFTGCGKNCPSKNQAKIRHRLWRFIQSFAVVMLQSSFLKLLLKVIVCIYQLQVVATVVVAVCNQCLSREVKRVKHRFGACICIKKGSSFFFSCILKDMKGLSTDAVLLLSLSPVLVLLPISHFLSSGIHSPMALWLVCSL